MRWPWKSAALGITPRHDLPSGWKVARVGDLAHLINGHPYDSKFFGQEGAPLIRIRDILGGSIETRYSGAPLTSRRVQYGDLLIGMDGDFNTGRWEHSEPGLLNQRVLAIEASSEISSWIGYCLPEPLAIINDLKYSTTVKHLTSKDVASIRIPLPRNTDLLKLLDFLDRETAEIDAFVADQERLIELLEERREATITHAVTKGLDPTVPMKDSGTEWVGSIPASWDIKRMSWLFGTISSGTTPPVQTSEYFDGEFNWVTTSELRETSITHTNRTITHKALREFPSLRLYGPGTLLIAMYGATIGRLGLLETSAATNQACCAFSEPVGTSSKFVFYVLLAAREHLMMLADGGGQPNINQEKLRSLRIPQPDFKTQIEIVDFLDQETSALDAAVLDAREAIALSKERRAALISAAVTGQIDMSQHDQPVVEAQVDEVWV